MKIFIKINKSLKQFIKKIEKQEKEKSKILIPIWANNVQVINQKVNFEALMSKFLLYKS
jgi:uncharacterized protein (UPF0335 family)